MKLTEIAIEGNTHSGRVQMGPLNRGLNFVYGENGAGKSTFASFLGEVLHAGSVRTTGLAGHVSCTSSSGSFLLNQSPDTTNRIDIQSLSNGYEPISVTSQISGEIAPGLHDAIYNFSLRDSSRLQFEIARLLHDQFSVAVGPEAADPSPQIDNQPQIDRLQADLNQLNSSIDSLLVMRDQITSDIAAEQASQQARLTDVNQQIEQLTYQLNQHNPSLLRSQLAAIEQEMRDLQTTIDNASATYVPHQPATPAVDSFAQLYRRLDEVDQQIQRWRHVQSDVQHQRVRLKDEMLVWNEMTLESDDHPYHNAREILIGLEAHLDEADQTASRWSGTTASQIDVAQMAKAVEELSQKMRDDLYALCAELSTQYKHIRQRAAAVELKQLRRCYHEMGENTSRLVQRRQQVIDEIRAVDPAGADAIIRSDQEFCKCAAHEGYLAARRRYLGDVQNVAPTVTRVALDLTAEHNRIADLNFQRNELIDRLNRTETDHSELERRLSTLIRQRDSISTSDLTRLNEQLRGIADDLRLKESDKLSLQRKITELQAQPVARSSAVLIHAGQLLQQMSNGELAQVFVSHHAGHDDPSHHRFDLQVRDSLGRVHNFTGIEQAAQDHVYLSLALAMVSALGGVELPIVIDDSFVHIGPDYVSATLKTLDEFCRQHDQQIFLLSQHRYLADRLSGLPVFELPPTRPASTPSSTPFRTTPVPRPVEHQLNSNFPPAAHDSYASRVRVADHNRPYPLSKYSTSPAALNLNGEDVDGDFRLPWSPLNRSTHTTDATARVRATSPRAFANEQASTTKVTIAATPLGSVGLLSAQEIGDLQDGGVTTVEHLLDLNPDQLDVSFQRIGLTADKINYWQATALMLWSIPGLLVEEARLLVAIGVDDPDAMSALDASQLFGEIQDFFSSDAGRQFRQRYASRSGWGSFNRDRVDSWYRSLAGNRSRWSSRRSRRSGSRRSRSGGWRNSSPRSSEPNSRDRAQTYRVSNYPQRQRMDHGNYDRERRSANRPASALRPVEARSDRDRSTSGSKSTASTNTQSTGSSDAKLKFYLNLTDDLEAAPSIGPKTAERFQKIGIITVADFLQQTAESIATRLNYKRLSADVLRTWQHQTRLVCRVPNLRGHDAQLLVACDVTDPNELAAMNPQALFDIIGPFSDTKEGLKIIRSGKKPDLAEVTDWINWAEHTRSLQAA